MEIGKVSIAMSQMKTNTSVNVAMICKAKEQAESNAQDLMKMLETTSVGSTGKLDVKI